MHAITTRRTLVLALLLPTAARAVSWHAGEHHHVNEGVGRGPQFNLPDVMISPRDATLIAGYYGGQTAAVAPLPPVQPHPWAFGQPLPAGLPAEPLPPDLKARVSPFYGYHYVRVGGDVLLLADDTGLVAAGMPILVR